MMENLRAVGASLEPRWGSLERSPSQYLVGTGINAPPKTMPSLWAFSFDVCLST